MNTEDTGEQPNVDMGNLDDFENDFYETDKGAEKTPTKEEVEEPVDEEAEEPAESEEVDSLETDEEEATEEAEDEGKEEPEEKPKRKHSAKERIDELTADKYAEKRAREAAESRLAQIERELATIKAGREKEEPEALREQLPPNAPNPDAVDKEGNPLYVLGEFDPQYIRDLTKFTIAEENKAYEQARAQKEWEEGVAAAQQELAQVWVEKVEKAEEEIPTLREDITELTSTFERIDPSYGEYLAMTIMQCENGPEIMHYFSQNIGEAQKIVASGPSAATLAIGRLEAQFAKKTSTEQGEQKQQKKVSTAPEPPEKSARGVNGRQLVRPDTDNLDAFGELFYEKK
jgi:hypothetical protein